MSATQPAFARSGEEMTPPATLADRAKRTVLRKVVDRLRPLAYRRGAGGIRCLRIYIGAFQTFRTTSTLRRRSFRLGSPGDHKASCRREPAHQAEQECTSFHQLFSIAPPLRQCISFVAGVEAHAWFWPR